MRIERGWERGERFGALYFIELCVVKYPYAQHSMHQQNSLENKAIQKIHSKYILAKSWYIIHGKWWKFSPIHIPRTISFSRMDLLMLIPRALFSEEFAARKKAVLFVSFWQNRSHNFTNFWLPLLSSFPTLFCHRLVPFCTFCCKPCYKNIEKKSSKITVFFFSMLLIFQKG